jgi:hypothetical protein
MNEKRQNQESSEVFWENRAAFDERELKLSLAVGGAGLTMAGISIAVIFAGIPAEGVLGLAAGSTLTYFGAKDALSEFKDYTQMKLLADRYRSQSGV